MELSAPTQAIFFAALVIAAAAIVGMFVTIPFVTANAFWVLAVGFGVLLLGNVLKNM